jgi:hypothetical protein
MTERRYTEAEVATIFERAAEAPQGGARQASPAQGLTLAELQEIGREVGIPAESIALAARTVEQRGGGAATSRTFLGLPIGVAHTVHLGRTLSEEEWERVVVDLRETFDARGKATSQGSLRQWTNGNLQALLEPTATGHRIRLRTTKGDAPGKLGGGLGMLGVSASMLVAAVLQGALGDTGMVSAMGFIGLMGAGMFTSSALRLPRWARTRRRQMEEVAARLAREAEGAPNEARDPRLTDG